MVSYDFLLRNEGQECHHVTEVLILLYVLTIFKL
jgi:hypothetical protein